MQNDSYWERLRGRQISRRRLLNASARASVGAAGLALVGCGDDDDDAPAVVQQAEEQAEQQQAEQQEQQAEQQAVAVDQAEEQVAAVEEAEEQAEQQAEAVAVGNVPTGEIRWANVGNFSGLEGVTGTGGNDHQILWPVHDNLVAYDQELSPSEDRSLSSWEIPEPLTVIFNLRQGVTYHDGTALTAESVRLHVERGQTLEGSNVKADLGSIATVGEPDEKTAVFNMSEPFSPLLRILGDRAGMLTSPAAFDRLNEPNARDHPVGTGAFEYVEESLDGAYVMEANKNYWLPGAPSVERLVATQGVNETQQANALIAGQFDIIFQTDPADLPRLRDAGFEIRTRPTNAVGLIYLNPLKEPWTNAHLRRAVNYGFDRSLLNDVVYEGENIPGIHGWLGPATGVYYDPNGDWGSDIDADRVREELALAGSPDGFEFDMNIVNTPIGIAQAEFIQASLSEFGIVMNLVTRPSPDYYLEYFEQEVAAFIAGMSVRADIWQQIAFVSKDNGPYDFAMPEDGDPDQEAAFTKVAETFDDAERVAAVQELARVNEALAWSIKLTYATARAAADPNLRNELFGDGKPHFGLNDVGWLNT
ncbi:MAG: ABC-type transport system, substrate-binding protein [Chloroflexi bacterium]|nr:MAG: ABC-type transport system, substrate-binding protein [Chloroflexota bacterium]